MDADRVKVFHRTDGDDVVLGVTDNLELDFLPARDTLFDQDLGDGGQAETVGRDVDQLFLIVGDTAAGAAQRKGRTDDNGIMDRFCKFNRVFDRRNDLRRDNRLMDSFHRILKALAVLRLVDRFGICTEQLNAVALEEAAFCQLHRKGQTGLAAEGGQKGVGLFDLDDPLADVKGQRLDINLVGHRLVGHDGRRVGV